jgi:hypothetical protein
MFKSRCGGIPRLGEKAAIRKPFNNRVLMKEVKVMSELSKRIRPGYIIVLCSLSCTVGIAISALLLFFSRF